MDEIKWQSIANRISGVPEQSVTVVNFLSKKTARSTLGIYVIICPAKHFHRFGIDRVYRLQVDASMFTSQSMICKSEMFENY